MKRIAAVAALMLAAVLTWAPALSATTEGVCPDNGTKVNVDGSHPSITVTAPEGKLIAGWCVKAGSLEQGDGPEFVVVEPPAAEVTIMHSSGKDVSHYTLTLVDVEVPPTTTEVPSRGVNVAIERVCMVESDYVAETLATIKIENTVVEWATVDVLGESLRLRPFSIGVVTERFTQEHTVAYTVTWDDGVTIEDTVTLVPLPSCLPVCPERVNGPLCPPAPTYPPVTTVPSGPQPTAPGPAATGVLSESEGDGDPELAFTGSHTDKLVVLGLIMIGLGGLPLVVRRRA